MKSNISDVELIQMIKSGGKHSDSAIRHIYSYSGWTDIVQKMVRGKNGSEQDAKDVIQEGLVILIMEITKKRDEEIKNLKAYFIGVCRNVWLNMFRRKLKGREIVDKNIVLEEKTEYIEEMIFQRELSDNLDILLNKLGRKCREVLKLWAMGHSHEEIAKIVSYENANVSKKTKSLCIQKLRQMGLRPEDWKY